MLRMKELTYEEITKVYENYMVYDFPKNELKPLSSIERMYQQGRYQGVILEKEDEVIAYGMLLQDSENKAYLLDYFAVLEEFRGEGYGSKALRCLLDFVEKDDLIVMEAENPKKAENSRAREIQEKRLEFYRKNGVRFTGLTSVVFDAAYVIMYLSGNDRVLAEEEIRKIYVDFYEKWILGREKCEKHFIMEQH